MSINKLMSACAITMAVCACSTQKTNEWFVSHNGNMPSNERIEQIAKGDSREKVRQVLGSPSTVVSLDKNTWIYMSADVKRVAFLAPEEVDRDVLTIRFDDKGTVTEVERMNKEHGREIKVSSDATEAPGEQIGFFRKYFGGVGQYNPFGGMGNNSSL
ncbi:MAG: outer membrane protein assembly factor BamE [Alphaproteobacteria bacterium]|nr:outer membrane protein assembly factor BamE [Alphaproteobacteria bacterium]